MYELKNIILYLCAAILATACGISIPEEPPRPGQEPCGDVTLQFVPTSVSLAAEAPLASGSTAVTLRRKGKRLPDTIYSIAHACDKNGFSVPAQVHFAEGAESVRLTIEYNFGISAGESASCTITAGASQNQAQAEVRVFCPSAPESVTSGRLRHFYGCSDVEIKFSRQNDGSCIYIAEAEGIKRHIRVSADGMASLLYGSHRSDDYNSLHDAYSTATDDEKRRMPGFATPGFTDGYLICYPVAYADGQGIRTLRWESLRPDGDPDWEDGGRCTYTDGWLLGVVSFENRPPLSPAENPWDAEVQHSRTVPGRIRICNLYREASPLSILNSCASASYLLIDTAMEPCIISRQFSGFTNGALFPTNFDIGGTAAIEHRGDTLIITVATPVHNAYGNFGDTWGKISPSIFTITP